MITSAIVKELIAAGVTGDALVMALERIEAASAECLRNSADMRDEQAERRRAADRERKRRLRNSAESAEMPSPLVPPLEVSPIPPSSTTSTLAGMVTCQCQCHALGTVLAPCKEPANHASSMPGVGSGGG